MTPLFARQFRRLFPPLPAPGFSAPAKARTQASVGLWAIIVVHVARSVFACGLLVSASNFVAADPPAPPRRPLEFGKTPPIPAPGLGDAQTPPQSGRQPVDVDVHSLQPYNLPLASRAKMRACGEQWRTLKLAGQATGLTWRLFAEKCLVQ